MGDSDELFARIIAGLEAPSTFGCSKQIKYYDCIMQFSYKIYCYINVVRCHSGCNYTSKSSCEYMHVMSREDVGLFHMKILLIAALCV